MDLRDAWKRTRHTLRAVGYLRYSLKVATAVPMVIGMGVTPTISNLRSAELDSPAVHIVSQPIGFVKIALPGTTSVLTTSAVLEPATGSLTLLAGSSVLME